MKKRYQVFVSSTFVDLQEERREIMQALLELRCIPSGMELFPASNDEQWKLIKRVIDDSDYYVIVIGGRYGSVHSSGISYTEMEYRYALETGKPIIGFLHESPSEIPAKNCEQTPEGKQKLAAFRELVERKMVKYWKNPHDLGSKVSRSIVNLIEDSPATGWIRADFVPNEEASLQILKLKQRIEELEEEARHTRTSAPSGTEQLASGDQLHTLRFSYRSQDPTTLKATTWTNSYKKSWNAIFARLGPVMIDEASDFILKREADKMILEDNWDEARKDTETKGQKLSDFKLEEDAFHTLKIQFKALGLIDRSDKQRSLKDQASYWSLTPYGDSLLTQLRAIPRSNKG